MKPEHKEKNNSWQLSLMITQLVLLVILIFQVSSLNSNFKTINTLPREVGVAQIPTPSNAPAPTQAVPTPTPSLDMVKLADDDPFIGNKDAPVTIVEWSDFECPFCSRFYSQTLGLIEENYINTGKVKLVFRDFPLSFHQSAQKAAEASECSDEQGKFWEMHDMIFENQQILSVENLKKWASDLGLDTKKFNECLDSGKYASEVQKDMADGSAAGIRGTPGFIINGQLISGAQPYANFESAIELALSK